MCGIAGYFSRNGSRPRSGLEKAMASLAHRGPDESGNFTDGPLSMGQTRLSIIDISGGRQPLFSEDRDLVLVANGEIYNFIELRESLERKGHRFLTRSDSEVIIHCYAQYGEDFLPHLNGMFAFALYDKKKDRLILARDRLGIKPLFLSEGADGVLFASEIKALLPLMDRAPSIDPRGLVQYFQNQYSTGPVTILQGVERILPGEAVIVTGGRLAKRWKYWSALDIEPREIGEPEARDEFDRIMEAVMVQHMRSDVPFGLFLSGGTDSAILLALLSRLGDKPVRTFSVGFPGTSLADELPAARSMARLFSSRHAEIKPSREDIFGVFPLTVWAADDLMRDYANLPTCLLSAAAARELKVVFSGEGGDEVFAGYGRYRAPWLERTAKSLFAPGSGGFRTRGHFRGRWPKTLFGSELRKADRDFRKPFTEIWAHTPDSWSDIMRMQYTDLFTALPDNLLVKADRMMMAWGLEGRVPFLDHRIVEFGLSLPDNLKVKSGQGKLFLKRWASKFIPEEHLFGLKKGFHVPVGDWLDGEFQQKLKTLLPAHMVVKEWFRPEGVHNLILACRRDNNAKRMAMAILQFAIWSNLFITGDGERPPVSMDPLELLAC